MPGSARLWAQCSTSHRLAHCGTVCVGASSPVWLCRAAEQASCLLLFPCSVTGLPRQLLCTFPALWDCGINNTLPCIMPFLSMIIRIKGIYLITGLLNYSSVEARLFGRVLIVLLGPWHALHSAAPGAAVRAQGTALVPHKHQCVSNRSSFCWGSGCRWSFRFRTSQGFAMLLFICFLLFHETPRLPPNTFDNEMISAERGFVFIWFDALSQK